MRVILAGFVDLGPLRGDKRAILVQAALLGLSLFGINLKECHVLLYSVVRFFKVRQPQWTRIFSSSLLSNARSDQLSSPDSILAATPRNLGH